MKCQNCKSPIPNGLEKYVKTKIVCKRCFNELKVRASSETMRWLIRQDYDYAKNI